MKIELLEEPELDFGQGRHIDVRFGLTNFGPLDRKRQPVPKSIRVGLVGTSQTIERLSQWLEKCRSGIAAKVSKQPNLFPAFPGFANESMFAAELVTDVSLTRSIPEGRLRLEGIEDPGRVAGEIFLQEIQALLSKSSADVLICAPPRNLRDVLDDADDPPADGVHRGKVEFHDYLKAIAMPAGVPLQLVWPYTYDASPGSRRRSRRGSYLGTQDEATRAWNLHVALYYKAGWRPWRLVRDSADLTSCYVGISFYRSLGGDLNTSVAQVFNERGEGFVVTGGPAEVSKDDRQPHLNEDDTKSLVIQALAKYRSEHGSPPARAVIHKTSSYSETELHGAIAGISDERLERFDLLSVTPSDTRLFREGENPPLRGTLLTLASNDFRLYTRGSVPFFEAYPGMYVPRPLRFRCYTANETGKFLGRESLGFLR